MPKTIVAKVTTMDAELELAIQQTTHGKQVFDLIAKTIAVRETWYFGLQFIDTKGDMSWLKLNRKISSQDVPSLKNGGPILLHFRAKFYPEDASEELIQDITQRLFFLQVKESIIGQEIYCPPETAVLLASYACQAKFDDFDQRIIDEGLIQQENLLPKRVMEQHSLTRIEWDEKICMWWKEHKGLMKEEAMLEYLKIAQDLEMYGVNYFEIKNKKGTILYLGVDALGLNIYEPSDKLTPKIGFPWSEIKNISFSEKKFIIKSVDRKAQDFIFYVTRIRVNKRILALCMGNHELYVRRRREDTIEMQQMKAQAKEDQLIKKVERERWRRERDAREDAERRLVDLKERLDAQSESHERSERLIEEYRDRIMELENKLKEENCIRVQLEEMKIKLEESNRILEEAKSSTSEDYERLITENTQIREEIAHKNAAIAQTGEELTTFREEMERLRLEREELEKKAKQWERQAVTLRPSDELDKDKKCFQHEFALHSNANQHLNRNEETRSTVLEVNQTLQSKLKHLSMDLRTQRDDQKMDHDDRLHEENQKVGRSKFQTLKQIRQGNTKKRIDEFECM